MKKLKKIGYIMLLGVMCGCEKTDVRLCREAEKCEMLGKREAAMNAYAEAVTLGNAAACKRLGDLMLVERFIHPLQAAVKENRYTSYDEWLLSAEKCLSDVRSLYDKAKCLGYTNGMNKAYESLDTCDYTFKEISEKVKMAKENVRMLAEKREQERIQEEQEAKRRKQEQLAQEEKAKREKEIAPYKETAATIVSKMRTGMPRDVATALESCAGNIAQFSGDFFSYNDDSGVLEIELSEQNANVVRNRRKIQAWTGCDNIIVRTTLTRGSVCGLPIRAYLLRCRNNKVKLTIRGWFYGKIDSKIEERYDENPFGLSYATQLTILVEDGELIVE